MKTMRLQDLLANTWQDRSRADQLLWHELLFYPNEGTLWSKDIEHELNNLQPTTDIFLSTLISFWADIALQQLKNRSSNFKDTAINDFSNEFSHLFPMKPMQIKLNDFQIFGLGVWLFIEKLGDQLINLQKIILSCCKHPDSLVFMTAEKVFTNMSSISNQSFYDLVLLAEQKTKSGSPHERAMMIAKHCDSERLNWLLSQISPCAEKNSIESKMAILSKLNKDLMPIAHQYLYSIPLNEWPLETVPYVINTIRLLSISNGFSNNLVNAVRRYASEPNQQQALLLESVSFLASHSAEKHEDLLLKLLQKQPHPWLLMNLCYSLASHNYIPKKIIDELVNKGLGNFEGYDEEPHNSVIYLLKSHPNTVEQYITEIIRWWNDTLPILGFDNESLWFIEQFLDLGDALKDANPLLPYLKQTLHHIKSLKVKPMLSMETHENIDLIEQELKQNMLNGGYTPHSAAAIASIQGQFLHEILNNFEDAQSNIDRNYETFVAEQRELLPELFTTHDTTTTDEVMIDEDEIEEPVVTRLINKITQLTSSLNY